MDMNTVIFFTTENNFFPLRLTYPGGLAVSASNSRMQHYCVMSQLVWSLWPERWSLLLVAPSPAALSWLLNLVETLLRGSACSICSDPVQEEHERTWT